LEILKKRRPDLYGQFTNCPRCNLAPEDYDHLWYCENSKDAAKTIKNAAGVSYLLNCEMESYAHSLSCDTIKLPEVPKAQDSITLDEDKSEHLEIDFSIINYNEVSYSNYITGGGNRKINPEVQTENNQEEDTEDNQETTEGEYEEGDTDSNSTISNQPEDNNPTDQEIIEPYSTGWDQDSNSEILVVKATSN
ncbi:10110_t:CDS:2, partial [Entrophospora sp. SA101]